MVASGSMRVRERNKLRNYPHLDNRSLLVKLHYFVFCEMHGMISPAVVSGEWVELPMHSSRIHGNLQVLVLRAWFL